MDELPTTIRCRVVKKSRWLRPGEKSLLKSISLDVEAGRYFYFGDERNSDYSYSQLNISCSDSVPCFFDGFEVGQVVELEIRAK